MTTRAERIAEIRERVSRATPGPWRAVRDNHPVLGWCCHVKRGNNNVVAVVGYVAEKSPYRICPQAEADAAFIAHARQDVPWLLEEVERLEHLLRTFVPGPAAVMIGDPE